LHAQIAEALEAHSPELMQSLPELFAQHYAEAGLIQRAVTYWGQAGQRSVTRSAMAEAATQYQRALNQLALLPDTPERQRQELEFQSALGAVLLAVRGYAAPETGRAYTRARELWEQLSSPSEFLRVPCGQSLYYTIRGDLARAQSLAEDLLHLSRQHSDSAGLVLGHYSAGLSLLFGGRLAASNFTWRRCFLSMTRSHTIF
jgi:predicted ATPase